MNGEFDVLQWESAGTTIHAYRRDRDLVAAAVKAAHLDGKTYWIQGGNNRGGVAASAGTHDGLSVGDLSVKHLAENEAIRLVVELRKRGAIAWLRSPRYDWPPRLGGAHIHFVIDGPRLSEAGRVQVRAYHAGRNGLANRKADPFPRPPMHEYRVGGAITHHHGTILANLRLGAHNADVTRLQTALHITADGHYGPQTAAAVTAYQKHKGWNATDGSRVGPKTAAALGLL